MINRLFSLACLAAVANNVTAFSPTMSYTRRSLPALNSSSDTETVITTSEDTDDVTCYITNDEEVVTEGEKPHIVCTSEPEDVSDICIVNIW